MTFKTMSMKNPFYYNRRQIQLFIIKWKNKELLQGNFSITVSDFLATTSGMAKGLQELSYLMVTMGFFPRVGACCSPVTSRLLMRLSIRHL